MLLCSSSALSSKSFALNGVHVVFWFWCAQSDINARGESMYLIVLFVSIVSTVPAALRRRRHALTDPTRFRSLVLFVSDATSTLCTVLYCAVVHRTPVRVAPEPAARHHLDAPLLRVPLLHAAHGVRRVRTARRRHVRRLSASPRPSKPSAHFCFYNPSVVRNQKSGLLILLCCTQCTRTRTVLVSS